MNKFTRVLLLMAPALSACAETGGDRAAPPVPAVAPAAASVAASKPASATGASQPAAAGASQPAVNPAQIGAFQQLFDGWLDARARLDPNWSTRAGRHEHDDALTRYDDVSWRARADLAAHTLAALEALDPSALSPELAIDWRLFRAQLRSEHHEYERRDLRALSPGLALGGISAVNDLLIRDFAPKEQRVRNAIERLRQIPAVCADLKAALRQPPVVWTRMALDDVNGALTFLDGVPALAGPAPGLDDALASARTALSDYRDFLQQDVLPRSSGDFAIGRAEFDWLLHENFLFGAEMNADVLLALGQKQFDVTLALLEETAREISPTRDWRSLLAEMMEQHPTAATLMDTYRDEVAHARQFLIDRHVVGIPDEKLQLRETPEFMRSTVPFAAYDSPAPLDPSRLGTFFVTPVPEAHILSDIPGTVWHEAYPGHHLQFVYAKDNPSLVRRLNESPLLSEGWGFYCEELAHETGYYDDPHERLMQLDWRLQRAARVILDVSVHTQGMSWAEAVDFLVRAVGMNRAQAEASVNAYTQQPTYFSSYMLGMLEIQRIREEFRQKLGPRFSLQEFHERLLRVGNVPPALVESELLRTWH